MASPFVDSTYMQAPGCDKYKVEKGYKTTRNYDTQRKVFSPVAKLDKSRNLTLKNK